jgi:hypothetical protein
MGVLHVPGSESESEMWGVRNESPDGVADGNVSTARPGYLDGNGLAVEDPDVELGGEQVVLHIFDGAGAHTEDLGRLEFKPLGVKNPEGLHLSVEEGVSRKDGPAGLTQLLVALVQPSGRVVARHAVGAHDGDAEGIERAAEVARQHVLVLPRPHMRQAQIRGALVPAQCLRDTEEMGKWCQLTFFVIVRERRPSKEAR